MKRIKVSAILFILFSASMMNYHEKSMSSVNFSNPTEVNTCSEKKVAEQSESCPKSETDNPGNMQEMSSGKNYEASVVIM